MAQTPIGDVDALSQAASACRNQGDEIRSLANSLANATSSTSWVSPMADHFRSDISGVKGQLDSIANSFETLGGQFATLANQVGDQMNLLSKIEKAVSLIIAEFNPASGKEPPWAGTPWNPLNLPGAFDPTWSEVAKALKISI